MAPRRGEERRCLRTTSAGGAGRSLLWDAAAGKARWSRSSGGWPLLGMARSCGPRGSAKGPRAVRPPSAAGEPRAPQGSSSGPSAPCRPRVTRDTRRGQNGGERVPKKDCRARGLLVLELLNFYLFFFILLSQFSFRHSRVLSGKGML